MMTSLNRLLFAATLVGALLPISATTFVWENQTGDENFISPANWDSPPAGGNHYLQLGTPTAKKAVLSEGATPNVAGLRIGYVDGNGELVQTGGELSATSVGHGATRLGAGGFTGIYRMSGGAARFNALQLGLGSSESTGAVYLSGGSSQFKESWLTTAYAWVTLEGVRKV